MKKILAGILFLFLVVGSCFAEFMMYNDKTYTGYIINCNAQTIEKVTLDYGVNLIGRGRFFYIEDDIVYEVTTQPDSWSRNKSTGRCYTMWTRYECKEKSMRESIIDYIKRVENYSELDLSDFLEKVENMEFEE